MASCIIDGCDNSGPLHRGLCGSHYGKWLRGSLHVDVPASLRPRRGPTCSVDGCDAEHVAKGLCHKHYSRLRKTGTTDDPFTEQCSAPNCNRPHKAMGYCLLHYERLKRHGDPRADQPPAACFCCSHPDRRIIDREILSGVSASEVGRRHGIQWGPVVNHGRNHLNFQFKVGPDCGICSHPDREEIEEALLGGESHASVTRRFGLTKGKTGRHMNPEHLEREATYHMNRLTALRSYVLSP